MLLTDEIREALQTAVDRLGSQAEVARRSGLHEVYIGRYLAGKNRSISDACAGKLMRFLRSQQLAVETVDPAEVIMNTKDLQSFINEQMTEKGVQLYNLAGAANMKPQTLRRLVTGELNTWFPSNLARLLAELDVEFSEAPLSPGELTLLHPAMKDGGIPTRPCWIFDMAQASGFDDIAGAIEPKSAWNCDVIPITDGRDCIGFKIEGNSMEPKFYEGDVVICDKHAELINGKAVVAKFDDRVVCKLYHKVGRTVLLQSIHPDGQSYERNLRDLHWCVRVIRFQREE